MSAPIVSGPVRGADGNDEVFGWRGAVDAWIHAGASRGAAENALKAADFDLGSFCLRKGSRCVFLSPPTLPRFTFIADHEQSPYLHEQSPYL